MAEKRKRKYKIRNWPEYNKSLIQRGSITLWFSEESRKKWYSNKQSGVKGHPEVYADESKKLGKALQKLSNRRPHDIVFDSNWA